jgi:SAM-dependent methyltransferase
MDRIRRPGESHAIEDEPVARRPFPSRLLRRLDHELRSAFSARNERSYDRRLGIVTSGLQDHSRSATARPEVHHAETYQAVPPRRFRALMAAVPLAPAEATFIDLGCGKGKALFMAAELGFRRVIGVEFAPDLVAVGEANADAFAAARPGAPPVEIVCADAGSYELPAEPTVLFLYNPFDEVVVARVRENVDRSLSEHPRQLYVVYLNSLHASVLDASRQLRRMSLDAELLKPARPQLFRDLRRHEHGGDLEAVFYEA